MDSGDPATLNSPGYRGIASIWLSVDANGMEQIQAIRPQLSVHDDNDIRTIADPDSVGAILGALEDEYCRSILEVMTTSFRTAQQISELCDMPISTTYRKLNTLDEVGLVETSIRIRRSGHHTKEFARSFEAVTIDLDDPEQTTIRIDPADTTSD